MGAGIGDHLSFSRFVSDLASTFLDPCGRVHIVEAALQEREQLAVQSVNAGPNFSHRAAIFRRLYARKFFSCGLFQVSIDYVTGLNKGVHMRIAAIMFALALPTPSFAADVKPGQQAGTEKEKLICRREVETGSLVRSKKICLSAKDWDLWSQESQRAYETMNRRVSGERGN